MEKGRSKFQVKISEGDIVIEEIRKSFKSLPGYVTFHEYIKSNMGFFLESGGTAKEIFKILRDRKIYEGSYSWFLRLFLSEKKNYLRKNPITIQEKTGENDYSFEKQKNESSPSNIGFEGSTNEIPAKYKLKRRANLEVPINEIQEALYAGAMLEDVFEKHTGVIFAPGGRDARRFQKWLSQDFCKKHDLEYRRKENMIVATKSEVLDLIPQLDLSPKQSFEED